MVGRRLTHHCPCCTLQRGRKTRSLATWVSIFAPPCLKCQQKMKLSHGRSQGGGMGSTEHMPGKVAKAGGSFISAKRRKALASWSLGYTQGCGNKTQGRSRAGEHLQRGTKGMSKRHRVAAHRSEIHQTPLQPRQPCTAQLPSLVRTSPRTWALFHAITSSFHLPGICTGQSRRAGTESAG